MRHNASQAAILTTSLAAVAIIVTISACDRQPAYEEMGKKGAVKMRGGPASDFAAEYEKAAALIDQGKLHEAEQIYDDLVIKEPDSPNPYVGKASCRMLEPGDHHAARTLYETALANDPKSVAALVGLGSFYSDEKDTTNAINYYQKALTLDESCPGVHSGLAKAYAVLGDKTQARLHLERFKQLLPQSRYLQQLEVYVEYCLNKNPANHEHQ